LKQKAFRLNMKLTPTAAKAGTLKIGVTGGIGAGKSVVCRIFSALGVAVYDADSRAKGLLVKDVELVRQVKGHFGEAAYTAEGVLNRAYLAEEVFADAEKLALLNSLVHPRVALDFDKWMKQQGDVPYVVKEAALIFEAGSHKGLNAVIAVSAPEELRVRRTLVRDEHRSRKQVQEIMQKQLEEEERLSRADYRITNDDKTLVIPQVWRLHKTFSLWK
jgi:dephospho-CoA kinase